MGQITFPRVFFTGLRNFVNGLKIAERRKNSKKRETCGKIAGLQPYGLHLRGAYLGSIFTAGGGYGVFFSFLCGPSRTYFFGV